MAFHPDELRGTHGRWAAGGRHRAVNRISVHQTAKRKATPVAERPHRTEGQAKKRYQASVGSIREAHAAFGRKERGEGLSRQDTSRLTKHVGGGPSSKDPNARYLVWKTRSREVAVPARREVQRPLHDLGPRVRAKRSPSGKAYVQRGWEMTDEGEHGQFHFYGRRTRVANLGGKKGSSKRSTVKRARDLMR